MVRSGPWVTVCALRHRRVVALPAQMRWQTGVLVTSMGLLGWSQTVPPRPSVPSETRQSCHRGPPFSPFVSVSGKWVRDVSRQPYCLRSRELPCAPPAPALQSCPPACPRLPLGFQSSPWSQGGPVLPLAGVQLRHRAPAGAWLPSALPGVARTALCAPRSQAFRGPSPPLQPEPTWDRTCPTSSLHAGRRERPWGLRSP